MLVSQPFNNLPTRKLLIRVRPLVRMRVTFAFSSSFFLSFFLLNHHYHHHLPLLDAPLLSLTSQGQSRRRSAVQLDRSRLPKENHPPSHLLFLAVSPHRGDTRPSVRRLRSRVPFLPPPPLLKYTPPRLPLSPPSRRRPLRKHPLQCPCDPRGAQTKLGKKRNQNTAFPQQPPLRGCLLFISV